MNRLVCIVLALAALCLVASAPASDCYSGRSYGGSYYSPYYYTPTYYTPYLTFSAPASDQGDTIKALAAGVLAANANALASKDEVIKVERERNAALQALIASGVPIPPELKAAIAPSRPSHPGLALIADSCQRCHNKRDGARDGDGKIMWDGDVFIGTREQLEKARDRIEAGTMPPKSTWTDKEKMLGLSGLTRMKIGDTPTAKAEPKIKEIPK